jgi:predicted extracellular nuclease
MNKIFLVLAIAVFSTSAIAQKERSIAEIQGEGHMSKFVGNSVRVKGIVTARIKNGFFLQTPDSEIDNDQNTSEGILVFTSSEPTAEATIGNLVSVTGLVSEYRPKSAPSSLSITQIELKKDVDKIKVISSANPLPKAITITDADFTANDYGQLEKYEGMRVFINALTVVAPTKGKVDLKNGITISDGVFYGVLKGKPRPFRTVGMSIQDIDSSKESVSWKKNIPKMQVFNSNPEVVRIESNTQLGARAIDVTSKAEVQNISGVMHFAFDRYTILTDVDSKIAVSGFIKSAPLPELSENQFSMAGMNIENFFDDEDDPAIKEDIVTTESFEGRMKKISMAIRDYLRFPDVIGITEAENLAGLKRLAERINLDAVASKKPDPKYQAYLIDSNDPRGIDVGYLVKSSRVQVNKVVQFGKEETYKNPVNKEDDNLNDRAPLMIQVTITEPSTGKQIDITVITNHLKSLLGYDDVKDGGLRVRTKKKLQAEFLAKFVQERQKANPSENIVLLGDFNAYQFNDGITDIIGTIKGTPATKDEILMPSEDLVDPDLIDLVDLIQADQRYSYTFDGNAQVLDHVLINQIMRKHIVGFGYARLNADFPEIYRNDLNRVERYSDHDAAVAYFQFEEKK